MLLLVPCQVSAFGLLAFATVAAAYASAFEEMKCGQGVSACGTLALMTGLGAGVQNVSGGAVYGHPHPIVHGLWPETPPYGDSACIAPRNATLPNRIYICYACTKGDTNCSDIKGHSPIDFELHEFGKHGVCADRFS